MFGLFGGSQSDIYGDQAGLSGGFGGGRGLGGMSNTLMMAGLGLASSPRTNPWENVMKGVAAGSALDERSNDKHADAAAVYQALRASGVPHEQAALAARSPAAAQILMDVRKQQITKDATNDAMSRAEKFLVLPGDASGAPRVSPAAPQPPVPSLKGGGRRSETPAEFAPMFAEKEKEYNLPEGYLARTAQLESSNNPNAKNPKSSASGLFQFINSTARQYNLTDPFDPVASTDAAARLAAINAAGLKRALGRDPTAGELYLAHQQGLGGATKILSNPNASVASLVGGEAARLNAGGGKTAGQFAQQWLNKFGASPARPTQIASADPTFMPGPLSDEDVGIAPSADPVAETKARTGVDWNNPVARQHMIDAGLTPPDAAPQTSAAAVPSRSADAPNSGSFTPSGPQGPLSGASSVSGKTFGAPQESPPTDSIEAQYARQIAEAEAQGNTTRAAQLREMQAISAKSRGVQAAGPAVSGGSPPLRPSYVGTPPGYDWKTATAPEEPAAQPPAQQQASAAVPMPPERPPETYTPRAPLRPIAAPPPSAGIDPNSSNAGAIQFAASGMGRGGMPAAPQPSRMAAAPQAAPVPANAANAANPGVQVAQAPAQTATDAAPSQQDQVAAQRGRHIIESTKTNPPEQYPAGSSSQRTAAQDFYRRGVALGMIAATPNLSEGTAKFLAKKSEWFLERAGKFIDPTDAEKVVNRLGLPPDQANELLRSTLPNQGLPEDIKKYEYSRRQGDTRTAEQWHADRSRTEQERALDELVKLGKLTPEQRANVLGGKTVQTPEGLVFMTPLAAAGGTAAPGATPTGSADAAPLAPGVIPIGPRKQTEGQKAQDEARRNLPDVLNKSGSALKIITDTRTHPGRKDWGATGFAAGEWSPIKEGIPNRPGRGFVALVNQIKGKAFLEAYETLKGGGQITEVEGKKATEAIVRLDRAQKDEDFDAALTDLEDVVRVGRRRAYEKAGIPAVNIPALERAWDAIGKGADRTKVIERLKKSGVEPLGF